MGLALEGEASPTMGIFLERKPVDLFVVGLRAGAGEVERAYTVTWSLPQRLRSAQMYSLANCGLHKASSCRDQKLEGDSGEPDWRMPHGGGWDPATSSLPLTLAQALPADGSATELDKTLGKHCIIYYRPISASPDPSQLRMPEASGRE